MYLPLVEVDIHKSCLVGERFTRLQLKEYFLYNKIDFMILYMKLANGVPRQHMEGKILESEQSAKKM